MRERLAELLKVKSVVTLVLTAGFTALAVSGSISGEQFLTVYTTVIAFYFGTQYNKR